MFIREVNPCHHDQTGGAMRHSTPLSSAQVYVQAALIPFASLHTS